MVNFLMCAVALSSTLLFIMFKSLTKETYVQPVTFLQLVLSNLIITTLMTVAIQVTNRPAAATDIAPTIYRDHHRRVDG